MMVGYDFSGLRDTYSILNQTHQINHTNQSSDSGGYDICGLWDTYSTLNHNHQINHKNQSSDRSLQ